MWNDVVNIIRIYIIPTVITLIGGVWAYREILPKILDYFRNWKKEKKDSKIEKENHKITLQTAVNQLTENQITFAMNQIRIVEERCEKIQKELDYTKEQCILLKEMLTEMHNRLLLAKSNISKLSMHTCKRCMVCSDHQPLTKNDANEFQIDIPNIAELLNPKPIKNSNQ